MAISRQNRRSSSSTSASSLCTINSPVSRTILSRAASATGTFRRISRQSRRRAWGRAEPAQSLSRLRASCSTAGWGALRQSRVSVSIMRKLPPCAFYPGGTEAPGLFLLFAVHDKVPQVVHGMVLFLHRAFAAAVLPAVEGELPDALFAPRVKGEFPLGKPAAHSGNALPHPVVRPHHPEYPVALHAFDEAGSRWVDDHRFNAFGGNSPARRQRAS